MATVCFFLTLALVRFILVLHQPTASADGTSDSNKTTSPLVPSSHRSLVVVVEVVCSVVFATGRSLVLGVGGGFLHSAFLTIIGLFGILTILFTIATMTVWKVFGCPWYGQCTACVAGAQGVDVCPIVNACSAAISGCGCFTPNWLVYGAIIVLLVVEVFIREPLDQALHDVYRRRLLLTFYKNGQDMRLCDVPRRPYFVCNATINNLQSPSIGVRTTQPFFLSPEYCGSSAVGYRGTKELNVFLAKGMALSGAAISVSTFQNTLLKTVMMLLGVDLGEWFAFTTQSKSLRLTAQLLSATPLLCLLLAHFERFHAHQTLLYTLSIFTYLVPTAAMVAWAVLLQFFRWNCANFFLLVPYFRRLYALLGLLSSKDDPVFHLSDGGHFDNLAVYQMLARGCDEIFVFDAGQDEAFTLRCLFDILTTAEDDLGCHVEFDSGAEFPGCSGDISSRLARIQNGAASKITENCFVTLSVLYPTTGTLPARRGRIWYAKSTLTGMESQWIKLFAMSDSEFPHHPTNNQAFDKTTFNAYRRLGAFAAEQVLASWKSLPPDNPEK
eukprot:NODE_266_length_1890_cov_113.789245_g215_i0.p1 GENE.NODE_266_length_1890_cov_113.789245_g215_i0~~NODE_266_length_1890_cov_113.789245_g215_i0.p1  ORF type:complete len:598 (-),score=120.62 NODE_266_length_1890_cov_113.789245_g215_i0:96-1760(-)